MNLYVFYMSLLNMLQRIYARFYCFFLFFIFRLVTWYKRNLIPRSGMNTFRGWWNSQIRFVLIWNLLVQLSLLHTHTDTLIQFAQDVFLACGLSYCTPFLLMQKWVEIIGKARQSVDFLKDQDVIRTVLNILQVLLSNQPWNLH